MKVDADTGEEVQTEDIRVMHQASALAANLTSAASRLHRGPAMKNDINHTLQTDGGARYGQGEPLSSTRNSRPKAP